MAKNLTEKKKFLKEYKNNEKSIWKKNLVREGLTPEQADLMIVVYQNPGINTNRIFDKLGVEDNRFVRQKLAKVLLNMLDENFLTTEEMYWKNGKVRERKWYLKDEDFLEEFELNEITVDFTNVKLPEGRRKTEQEEFQWVFPVENKYAKLKELLNILEADLEKIKNQVEVLTTVLE